MTKIRFFKDFSEKKIIFRNYRNGFTQIEFLVAMALFLILITVAVSGFIRALRTQKIIIELMAANDNTSLALEQVAREIRTGYHFMKTSPTELRFVNAENIVVFYRLNDGAIERGTEDPLLRRTYKKITADNVRIINFATALMGEKSGDGYPPRITITLSVTGIGKYVRDIRVDIQTTISSKILDT